jgi:excisionase family DNA binding protein
MSETMALSVPEAAARLGRSERTVWRQIRAGELPVRRQGRRVFVVIDPMSAWSGREPHATGTAESAVAYDATQARSQGEWHVGAWPYTPEVIERHRKARQAKLHRRRAAFALMDELAKHTKPDPDGLTVVDYLHAYKDHPRALGGSEAEERALEEMARERRSRR